MGWDPRRLPDQTGKTFVVTGGNAGIGYFISEQLAAAGGTVVIAARTPRKADAAIASICTVVPGASITSATLDLSSYETVRAGAAELGSLGRIDALIENAGAVMPSRERQETVDGNELMFGTNHLGHFLLTALLYPLLRNTPGSRVVTMGSAATRLRPIDLDDLQSTRKYSGFSAYAQSKHATQAFGFELDRRLRASASSVTALVAHPGGAQDGNSPARPGVIEPTVAERARAKLLFVVGGGKDKGAWPAVRAALDPDAQGGQYWGPRWSIGGPPVVQKPVSSSHSEELGRALWGISERLVG
ncbi:MAG TPA: SDR family NAD(P)-dependent oxidoreductase, partial [Lacisediminihabitans sp.]|uniref:SDR family NAD(P)-dependent oxidoreductase n=1 Tax=Lacisediminihabitans sp. TaxID=2787631 RepID=UPI002ED88BEC